ncbi:MAG: DUF523 domain-containing protein [Candidatus Aegiribacteria sp.]|nr:DUF523 domain-containing protein [Candidatus Aegiribacteria sp.]MBD3295469.1 DUF523 domain-containing protein [Candidatus Fermentibacteria bacterium]
MGVVLASACLCGIPCRYDGRSRPVTRFVKLLGKGCCIPFCPEILGGLTTPREPALISGGTGFDVLDGNARVILRDIPGDVTEEFIRGAYAASIYARLYQPETVFLKEKSPSCGLLSGNGMPGVTAALLKREGYDLEPMD